MRLSNRKREELYLQFLPMATERATFIARKFPVAVQDVIDEAQSFLGEYLCGEKFGDAGVSASTELWRQLTWHIQNWAIAPHRRRSKVVLEAEFDDEHKPLKNAADNSERRFIDRILDVLSEDGREVVKLLINPPPRLAAKVTPRHFKAAPIVVKAYLSRQGWRATRIAAAWREVTEAMAA